jgi:hypothetical protein
MLQNIIPNWGALQARYESRAFPGRSAARSGALLTRDRRRLGVCHGPGSAVHRFTLHRIRETCEQRCHRHIDICHRISYVRFISRPIGRGLEAFQAARASAVPARGLATRSRAALGINPSALGPGREVQSLDWDRQGWGKPVIQRGRVPGSMA